jgi:hypothetical protein
VQKRPSIIGTMRHVDIDVNARGEEVVTRRCGGGVVVVVKPDSTSRRKFRAWCEHRRVTFWPAETAGNADGRFNPCTGEDEQEFRAAVAAAAAFYGSNPAGVELQNADASVTAWNVVAPGELLGELLGLGEDGERVGAGKPFVKNWHYAVNAALPHTPQGQGEPKVRAGSGTAFGRPATVAATAAQLAREHNERMRAAGLPAGDE